jgi:hypothetical protein
VRIVFAAGRRIFDGGEVIVAIVCSAAITVTRMVIAHRERIAMIERGILPGDMPEER